MIDELKCPICGQATRVYMENARKDRLCGKHAYEKILPIDADQRHDLHPDFCLPGYGDDTDDIYIEYWGYNEKNIEYTKSKNYKMKIYKDLKITLICLEEKDIMDISASLSRKLKFYKKGQINEYLKMTSR